MLGGNESIPNLLILGSTNLFNKIDDAILRRFNANFYVGLPNKEERKSIFLRKYPAIERKGINLDFLVEITPNFSGAGIDAICQRVIKE